MLNPYYIVGFVDGEGCFSISLNKNNDRLTEVRLEQFCEVAELIKTKQHLISKGIGRIQALKRRDSLDALDAHVQWGATEIT